MKLHTRKEVATLLHCTEQTIRRLCASGKLDYLKRGRQTLFTDRYIEDYITRSSVKVRRR